MQPGLGLGPSFVEHAVGPQFVGELAGADIDERGGVLRINESKFNKSRLVPMSWSVARDMRGYLEALDAVEAYQRNGLRAVKSRYWEPPQEPEGSAD